MSEPILFEPAGPGVSIALMLSDLIELEKTVSDGPPVGTIEIMRQLTAMNTSTIKAGLSVALKNPDGSRWAGDLDSLDFSIQQASDALSDAIALKVFGKPIFEGDADES